MHAATIVPRQPSDHDSPSPGRQGVVWVTHSSRRLAADLVCTLRSLALDAKLWDEAQATGERPAPCDVVVADPAGLRLMASCVHGAPSVSAGGLKPARRGGLAPRALRRVVEHIEVRIGERIDIGELAAVAGLSECHFSRVFGQSVGMPPHRYVMSRRIAVGAGLLERTELSITEVALSVGFSDHSYFTRMFVRMTGEAPSSYRHRHR